MSVNFSPAIVRRGVFHSLRFEVASILTVGVMLPVVAMALIEGYLPAGLAGVWLWLEQPAVINSIIGVTISACVSLTVLRRLRFFPGVAVALSLIHI